LSHIEGIVFGVVVVLLVIMSAFFSCAETGLMAINRYRLRHKARLKKKSAMLILELLKRPDRLLGMILIGNNLANILASAIATLVAVHYFGDKGVILSTAILTIVVLVFAEVAPKTLAALYPEKISTWVAWPVFILLKIFYPLVVFINALSNGLLRLFNIRVSGRISEPLSREELRSVVYETTGKISHQYQTMLLSILDLNKVGIEDVMIPRHEIVGIDLEQDWSVIQKQLSHSPHDWLPVYRESINDVAGILHLRELMHSAVSGETISKDMVISKLHDPYFVPEGTSLNIQLLNFQQKRKRLALVVDEYGEIQGLVTLEDILEEIVGDFTTTVASTNKKIEEQSDGSYLVDGTVGIRELNRMTTWSLPTKGPRTLSGLIIEHLEAIPKAGICLKIAGYPIEIVHVEENRVTVARVFAKM
jgi:Mg2+/Co2+ transporter CorB